MGVHFRPGGTWRLLGMPAHELGDARVGLRELLGQESDRILERLMSEPGAERKLRLLERLLCARRLKSLHPTVAWAASQIARYPDTAQVGLLAEEAGLSARRFSEVFAREVGVNPKGDIRLKRFQSALLRIHAASDPDWCELAALAGYADQAHLIRDFREFSGMTPSAYHALRGPMPHLVPHLPPPCLPAIAAA